MDKKLSYLYNITGENKNMGLLKLKTKSKKRNLVAFLQRYKLSSCKEMHLSKGILLIKAFASKLYVIRIPGLNSN